MASTYCTGAPDPNIPDDFIPGWADCGLTLLGAIANAACLAGCFVPEPTGATKVACAACVSALAAGTGLAWGSGSLADCVCWFNGCVGYSGGPTSGYCYDCENDPGENPGPCSGSDSGGMPGQACDPQTGCCNIQNANGDSLTCSGISPSMALRPSDQQTPDRCAFSSCINECNSTDGHQCHPINVGAFQACTLDIDSGCYKWGPGQLCINGQDNCSDNLLACSSNQCPNGCNIGSKKCDETNVNGYRDCVAESGDTGCGEWSLLKVCEGSTECEADKTACSPGVGWDL